MSLHASDVLVSGAGFAGLATAFWLDRLGYRVTVAEIAPGLRHGGTPVDIEGEALAVTARMGLLDAVRDKALPPRRVEFLGADGGTLGLMPAQSDIRDEKHEIHRDDLLDILFAAVDGRVRTLFGRTIIALDETDQGVTATFDNGHRHEFALVFGCDGNRSNTRRLTFGENDVSLFMGGYFAIKVVPTVKFLPANVTQILSVAGRAVLLNGYSDRTDIGAVFRAPHPLEHDHRDRAWQRRVLQERFAGLGWQVPALLRELVADDGFYFDSINQIRMPAWSRGRVALVGDAGYCVSPVAGFGGSMALIGAAHLGEALAAHPGDHAAAFATYEQGLRPLVTRVQDKAVARGMSFMFPATDIELERRNMAISDGSFDL